MPAPSSRRPVLLAPTGGQPADAALATFSWEAAHLDGQRFQLAADRRFESILWDVPADGITQLTLQSALPRTDTTYYWRVGREQAWSAPAAFRAATDEDVAAWEWARHEATVRAARAQQREREAPHDEEHATGTGAPRLVAAPDGAPHLTGHTSRREVMLWASIIVVSFGITLFLIAGAVLA